MGRERVARLAAGEDEASLLPGADVDDHPQGGDRHRVPERVQRRGARLSDRVAIAAAGEGPEVEERRQGPHLGHRVTEDQRPNLSPAPCRRVAAELSPETAEHVAERARDRGVPALGEEARTVADQGDEVAGPAQTEERVRRQPGEAAPEHPREGARRLLLGDLAVEAGQEELKDRRRRRVGAGDPVPVLEEAAGRLEIAAADQRPEDRRPQLSPGDHRLIELHRHRRLDVPILAPLEELGDPGLAVPVEPIDPEEGLRAGGDGLVVRGRDEARRGRVDPRHLRVGDGRLLPAHLRIGGGHRQRPEALASPRHLTDELPADAPVGVAVDEVERHRRPLLQALTKVGEGA